MSLAVPNRSGAVDPFDLLVDIDDLCRQRAQQAARDAVLPEGSVRGLAFRLEPWPLLVPFDRIAEITTVPAFTKVPAVRSWLVGICQRAGSIVTLVDLREYLTGRPLAIGSSVRVVVLKGEGWLCGVLVDEVVGMRTYHVPDQHPPGGEVDKDVLQYVRAVCRGSEENWWLFEPERLLQEPSFLRASI